MAKLNKQLAIALAIASAGVVGIGATHTFAAAASSTSTTRDSALIDALVSKFNLNKTDVQKVVDDTHTAQEATRTAEMKASEETRLSGLVTDGKITEAQKALIIAKQAEMQASREANHTAMEGKTDAERKTAMDAERTALQKWATDNGIDISYLRPAGGPGGRGGHHGGMGRGMMGDPAAASTTTTQ